MKAEILKSQATDVLIKTDVGDQRILENSYLRRLRERELACARVVAGEESLRREGIVSGI